MTRSEFLRLVALGSVGGAIGARLPGVAGAASAQTTRAVDSDRQSRIARVISEYDAQGIHRTATEVDDRSAEWLKKLAEEGGAVARLDPFELSRVDVGAAYVEADGRRFEGVPFFDGGFTEAAGITGALGAPDTGAEIALVTIDQAAISSEGQSLATLRRSGSVKAIIGVTRGGRDGLCPSNAVSFTKPYGVPVLQVGSEAGAWLDARARAKQTVTCVAHATRTPARASNVLATVDGRDGSLAPVVVMTPRSGWWRCASERGGGLACWMEILRGVAAQRPKRPVLFVASSGHELGHLGLDLFLEHRRDLIKSAAAWMHLGANIGAAEGGARLQASDDQIEAIAGAALERTGAVVRQRVPRGTVPAGEARNIHVGGGRYISLLGSGPWFHNPGDRFPAAVDIPAVAAFAAGLADVAIALANT